MLSGFAIACAIGVGCSKPTAPPEVHIEPAQVAHHVDESELNTITLTERAEQRLGIVLVETTFSSLRRQRTIGGEVMIPPGKTAVISAPVAGTLAAPGDSGMPIAGSHVRAGQAIFKFTPMLTAERDVLTPSERVRVAQSRADVATTQIDAERQVVSAKVTVEAAQIAAARAAKLLEIKAGSQRAVDEAEANLELAEEALKTAEARHAFLSSLELDSHAGELSSRDIESPVSGVLQQINSAPGETVVAGKPLFTIITLDRVWVRVPIYVGQRREVDIEQPAMVGEFGDVAATASWPATYVSAPPTANPLATTVDFHYELDNQDEALYPGQKLAVSVPLKTHTRRLAVPFKAVLYDIHGGAWVYEHIGDHAYARRRVAVEYVVGDLAVLASGPPDGSKVVTDGAAELFGTEFGVGH